MKHFFFHSFFLTFFTLLKGSSENHNAFNERHAFAYLSQEVREQRFAQFIRNSHIHPTIFFPALTRHCLKEDRNVEDALMVLNALRQFMEITQINPEPLITTLRQTDTEGVINQLKSSTLLLSRTIPNNTAFTEEELNEFYWGHFIIKKISATGPYLMPR